MELVKRIKVNELLGNYDAHLKNFSLLYVHPNAAMLSPAYDIVAYSAYLGGRGHALKFLPNQTALTQLTPAVVRQLANAWEITELSLRRALTETVDLAMQRWPALLKELPLTAAQAKAIWKHVQNNGAAKAWNRRQEARSKAALTPSQSASSAT